MAVGHRNIVKITLLGDGAVGKTSLRKTYLGEGFKNGYNMTLGADFAVKKISLNNTEYTSQIWDLAGQQRFSAVREVYYRGTTGALLVFDISRRSSFENIPSWIAELVTCNSNRVISIVLIGNKSDLRPYTDDCVQREQAEEYARALSLWAGFSVPYIETCALTGENVEEAFTALLNSTDSSSDRGGLTPFPRDPGDDMTGAAAGMARRYKEKREE